MLCAMFSSDVGMLRLLAEHKADVNMSVKGLGDLATTRTTRTTHLRRPVSASVFIISISSISVSLYEIFVYHIILHVFNQLHLCLFSLSNQIYIL